MRERDEDLVQRVKEGDLRAFDELYARYLDSIYRYIYKKTFHHQDTEDICQEVFIRVFRYIRHFKSEASFVRWVYTIAKNETLRHFKKRRSKEVIYPFLLEKQKQSIVQVDDESSFKPFLKEAINRLSPRQRKVVILHGLKEMSFSDTSSILGKSKQATKSIYYRALRNLREHLS